jgi:hypothetical protein
LRDKLTKPRCEASSQPTAATDSQAFVSPVKITPGGADFLYQSPDAFTTAQDFYPLTGENGGNGASIQKPPFTLFPPVKTSSRTFVQKHGVIGIMMLVICWTRVTRG